MIFHVARVAAAVVATAVHPWARDATTLKSLSWAWPAAATIPSPMPDSPAAILRAITTTGELRLGLGANREFMVRSSGPSHFLQMKGQDGQQSVVGNYFVRVVQIREEATTIVTGVGS